MNTEIKTKIPQNIQNITLKEFSINWLEFKDKVKQSTNDDQTLQEKFTL